jgi:Skp family chaperone for outer membrane proteins
MNMETDWLLADSIDITQLTPHPAAALYPMLSDDELKELADDIAANGLLFPIVLYQGNQILDGRNRLSACNLAGVQPTFTEYEGDDPVGYVLSVNEHRRHMTQGQRAMCVAMATFLSQKFGHDTRFAESMKVSNARLSYARSVQEHAPDLVDEVIQGSITLDAAYKEAQTRRKEASDRQRRVEGIRQHFNDLADRLEAEEMTLEDALAEAAERQAEAEREAKAHQQRVQLQSDSLATAVRYIYETLAHQEARSVVIGLFDNRASGVPFEVTPEKIIDAGKYLQDLGEEWSQQ